MRRRLAAPSPDDWPNAGVAATNGRDLSKEQCHARALEVAPEEERAKITRQLAPAYNALSASRVGLSQAREAISRDAVVASQQARHSHQQAFEAMYFEGEKWH